MSLCGELTAKKYIIFTGTLVLAIVIYLFSCMGGSSSKNMSKPYVVAAQARHTATLIFLHGLGDTGEGWSQIFRQLKLKNIKCICPTAPVIPVTLNGGMQMPSWYDILSLEPQGPEDDAGINAAANSLRKLIVTEEENGISSDNVIVGGFSQGGAIALYTALTHEKPLAGVVGLSTWLPLNKEFPQGLKVNRDIPVFQAHGEHDPLVPIKWGNLTGALVKQMTTKHTFKAYPMMHTSCPEEMEEVRNFLNSLAKD
ncbi:acyl-protein thioesterase 1-like [Mercenaria mercenaria]|uniref:acyl-protein thioesterase 1-like n=1 Tax=Mercenaria mercenaria TaxID=6596 RepID=UPI00234F7CDF|nr:acyl-protein thioesterase 1-like [Mercenaria mercenaria]